MIPASLTHMHAKLEVVTHHAVLQPHDFIRFPRIYNSNFDIVAAITALSIKLENPTTQ
jgi:hypothetical protein